MWQRLWWPLSCRLNKKLSFKATARDRDNPLSKGIEGCPFRREGTHNAWGVCLLVCPIYTTTASEHKTGESQCVAFSLFLSLPFLPLFSLFLLYFVSLSHPRPSNIGVDKPPVHCGTLRAIPANQGHRMTILLWKSETLGWIEPLCNLRGTGDTFACVYRMFTIAG